jgi:hypothetical protein
MASWSSCGLNRPQKRRRHDPGHRHGRDGPDPFTRLAIEILARTGMRRSEMLGLTIDAVVQIGSAYWLRVPVGKMHTDRYVPLHPQLKTLLDDWLLHRPEGLCSNLLFSDPGRPVNASRIEAAVRKAAQQAGLGRVTPHQLRHTLATQAINRGMSLEAIVALLGHRSLSMTRVYARIADRTVVDEYFAVSEKVEALYDARAGYRPTPRARRWPSSAGRCTAGCSATATALAPSRWTANSSRSANRARSSSPRSSSGPPSNASETTRQRRDKSHASGSSTDSSADSTEKPPDEHQ